MIVRSENGTVVIDLDGDGREQSGWSLLYLHVAEKGRVEKGTFVLTEDRLGHPSCEGGTATGTHIHFARKYNGEWILADGPLPFNLSGWVAQAGSKPYQGLLTRDGEQVQACTCSSAETLIQR
jgi:murein DD-endopeptidase MepM/ murein hydrolase activator NlpD